MTIKEKADVIVDETANLIVEETAGLPVEETDELTIEETVDVIVYKTNDDTVKGTDALPRKPHSLFSILLNNNTFKISCLSANCRVPCSLLPLTADVTVEETDNVTVDETAGYICC